MTEIARDPKIRFRRTHDNLRHDITRDPIFLLQERTVLSCNCGSYSYDAELDAIVDDDGNEVSTDFLIAEGLATVHWNTLTVFLTREDGEEFGRRTSYRYPQGWRVYCVHAEGDLVHVLAAATLEGRYG